MRGCCEFFENLIFLQSKISDWELRRAEGKEDAQNDERFGEKEEVKRLYKMLWNRKKKTER